MLEWAWAASILLPHAPSLQRPTFHTVLPLKHIPQTALLHLTLSAPTGLRPSGPPQPPVRPAHGLRAHLPGLLSGTAVTRAMLGFEGHILRRKGTAN